MMKRIFRRVRLAHIAILAAVLGCGGPIEEDVALITGKEPGPTPVPAALSQTTRISQISFQAGTGNILLELFDKNGFCFLNKTTDILALAGDFRGRPVPD